MEENRQDTVGFAQYEALRIEMQDRLEDQLRETRELHERRVKHWRVATMTSLAVLFLFLAGIIGSAVYILNTYDFQTYSYNQDRHGISNVNNGTQGDLDYGAESNSKDD